MIVVAGEALVDLVVTAGGVVAAPGGAPYNVARACGRLGARTALAASLSVDGFGRQLRAGLADCGVDDSLLQLTERPTTLALAELDADGVATYRFYSESTSAPLLTPGPLPEPTIALVTGGLALVLEPMGRGVERLVTEAPAHVLVVIDVNARPQAIADRLGYLERLRAVSARADVLKVSHEDLAYLSPDATAHEAALELLEAGVRAVLVTGGEHDTSIVTAAGALDVPVTQVPVVDTIGAGDAFTAGFVAWWVGHGGPVAELIEALAVLPAVQAAHAVAGVVVGRRGADPPAADDVPGGWPPL